jgi:hypothetical protein
MPAISSGGCGLDVGRGLAVCSVPGVHIDNASWMVDSRYSNRSAVGGNGSPIAAASPSAWPVPTPSHARPPDSTSTEVTALTSRLDGRNVTPVTIVPSRIRSVFAARYPSVVYASSISVSSGGANGSTCNKWSATQSVSSPPSSARVATSPSAVTRSPCQE